MAQIENQKVRGLVYRYWRWYIDSVNLSDESDEAKMLRHYMGKIAQQSFEIGQGACPEPERPV